ncbi:Lipase-like PAD4 [Vitis vinifera]|uniref:Lipase-like PAD4 n=1 Tax=Vitis vinifera TaxID=29760 RepID=A0A438KJG9_VITVI|nr:Lipase-like PAD4 [Vitis vinifera]
MDAETSLFESSEMLATFISSTPVLQDSWRLCSLANTSASVVTDQVRGIAYVAFSGPLCPLLQTPAALTWRLWTAPLMAFFHRCSSAMLSISTKTLLCFMLPFYITSSPCTPHRPFLIRFDSNRESKAVVMTGHSMGGAVASLSALWLLSHLQSTSSALPVLCITFGSPLLGNEALSRAILRERWAGNFCHVVSNHDFRAKTLLGSFTFLVYPAATFCPTILALVDDFSAISFRDNPVISFCVAFRSGIGGHHRRRMAAVKMLELMFTTASPGFTQGEPPESSYEAGVALAVQSCGLAGQESIAGPAKDCLKMAKRVNPLPPHLNSANLAITLSKNVPYRAQIEWFKASCDKSDDQMATTTPSN